MNIKSFLFLLFFFALHCSIFGQGNRYVKVVDRDSGKRLDSFEVSFYRVACYSFIPIGQPSITDTNGLAKVPDSISVDSNISYKVNATDIKIFQSPRYFPEVANVKGFTHDTIIVMVDILIADPPRLQGAYFAFKSDRLIDFYKADLDHLPKILEILTKNPKWKVELEGHTDNKEDSATHHMNLSQKRADTVKAYLISKGIDKDRISTKSFGGSMPLVPNEKDGQDDPEGRARNRRVEFTVIPDEPENKK
jgi:outer membrane protein OmpA-like peptidoglycan-associated protein